MVVRLLALVATVWVAAYVAAYLRVVRSDGNPPAWWYVGLIVVSALPLIAVTAGWTSRLALLGSAAGLGLSAVIGLLTVGIFLLPAVFCVIIAAVLPRPASHPSP